MTVVSVINYKGGVGKTTTTANLAAELAWRKKKVLMLDLDPQASLTFSFIKPEEWRDKYEKHKTIKAWYDAMDKGKSLDLTDLTITPENAKGRLQDRGKLDLICSHLGLLNVDLELATELGGATPKKQRQNHIKVHGRLAEGLAAMPDDLYDFVLIDCPPNFNIVTRNAITCSEFILVPAKADYLSTLGISYLQRHLNEFVKDYNTFASAEGDDEVSEIDPRILGVYFTMIQYKNGIPISALRPFIDQTKKLGIPVLEAKMRENKTQFGIAPQEGIPVVMNRGRTDTEVTVISELEELAEEFLEKIEEAE